MASYSSLFSSGAGRLILDVNTISYDVTTNSSKVRCDLRLEKLLSYSSYNYIGCEISMTINGQVLFSQDWFDVRSMKVGDIHTYATETITINHAPNGKQEIEVKAYFKTGVQFGTASINEMFTCADIPRQANITSAPGFNDEENPTISYSNPAGSAVDGLAACISLDGESDTISYVSINKTGTSYTWALTEAQRNLFRNATLSGSNERTVYFIIRTIIGSNTFYDKKAVTFTVINAKPVLAPVAYDTNEATKALTGNNKHIIKGHNKVYVAANAEPRKGATITGVKVWANDVSIATDSGYLENIDTSNITFKAGDNRGQSTEVTPNILYLVEYTELTNQLSGKIEITGETIAKITLTMEGVFFNSSFGAVDNTLALYYKIKQNNEDYTGDWISIAATPTYNKGKFKATYAINNLDYQNSYTVRVMAVDKLNTVYSNEITLKAIPVFDWSKTDFNFNVPITVKGVALDYPVETGTNNGWDYIKWNSGKAECWKTLTHRTAVNTEWGSLFCGNATSRQDYPFNFTKKPVEQVSLTSGSYQGLLFPEKDGNGENSAVSSACYNICRPSSVSSSAFYINFYVVGKWR